jgi:hypothetical protein
LRLRVTVFYGFSCVRPARRRDASRREIFRCPPPPPRGYRFFLLLHGLPLSLRNTNLARLLRGRTDGIFVAPFEQGEIGPDLFKALFCNSRTGFP